MIKILDEEELEKIQKKSNGRMLLGKDSQAFKKEIDRLRRELHEKTLELEKLRSLRDPTAIEEKYKARMEILNREMTLKDEEIQRLRERHVKDVEIIARLNDRIESLREEVEDLRNEVERLRKELARRPVEFEPAPAEIATNSGSEIDVERYELKPDEFEGPIKKAVVIPLDEEGVEFEIEERPRFKLKKVQPIK